MQKYTITVLPVETPAKIRERFDSVENQAVKDALLYAFRLNKNEKSWIFVPTDFDLATSFIEVLGRSDDYKFKPNISYVVKDPDLKLGRSIESGDTVQNPLSLQGSTNVSNELPNIKPIENPPTKQSSQTQTFNNNIQIPRQNIPTNNFPFKEPIRGVFDLWENSCYLDTLLMILLGVFEPFWRLAIFQGPLFGEQEKNNTKVSTRSSVIVSSTQELYDSGGQLLPPIPCTSTSYVRTADDFVRLSKRVRDEIRYSYETLSGSQNYFENRFQQQTKTSTRCFKIRQLLANCQTEMLRNQTWVQFENGVVYDLICKMFPKLLLNVRITKSSETISGRPFLSQTQLLTSTQDIPKFEYRIERLPYLLFGQFLRVQSASLKDEDTGEWKYITESIDWDYLVENNEILAFWNGDYVSFDRSNPARRRMDTPFQPTSESEISTDMSFGETILNNQFELVGVISLMGVFNQQQLGYHFVCYFKGVNQQWFYYNTNSSQPIFRNMLPRKGVWEFSDDGVLPSMYFYAKRKQFEQ